MAYIELWRGCDGLGRRANMVRSALFQPIDEPMSDTVRGVLFDVLSAERTLPLVSRVVRDLTAAHATLSHLAILDRFVAFVAGREPNEPAQKAAHIAAEYEEAASAVLHLSGELRMIGAAGCDLVRGVVDFPTIVNESLAYLVYCLGDSGVQYWRYRDQKQLRPIPESWRLPAPSNADLSK